MSQLALFDVDGTLFLTHDEVAVAAFDATLADHFGVTAAEDALDRVDHAGQTSLRIARLVLREIGVPENAIDDTLRSWCASFAECYLEQLARADTRGWRAAPHAASALERLRSAGIRLALLTGNPEPVARARLERLELARFFPRGQGAFGCEREDRRDLIELAVRRGGVPRSEAVAVGDTPRDARSAHESGIRSVIVQSHRHAGPFPGADAVCSDLDEAATQVLAWSG